MSIQRNYIKIVRYEIRKSQSYFGIALSSPSGSHTGPGNNSADREIVVTFVAKIKLLYAVSGPEHQTTLPGIVYFYKQVLLLTNNESGSNIFFVTFKCISK